MDLGQTEVTAERLVLELAGPMTDADAELLTFQVESYMMLANAQFVVSGSQAPLEQARRAVDQLLEGVATAT
mgnify:CR=1 FL=1